jgi:hypothetical protein
MTTLSAAVQAAAGVVAVSAIDKTLIERKDEIAALPLDQEARSEEAPRGRSSCLVLVSPTPPQRAAADFCRCVPDAASLRAAADFFWGLPDAASGRDQRAWRRERASSRGVVRAVVRS